MEENETIAFQRLISNFVGCIFAGLVTIAIQLLSDRTHLTAIELMKVIFGMTMGAGITNFLYSELANDRAGLSQVKTALVLFVVVVVVMVSAKVVMTRSGVEIRIDNQTAFVVTWLLLPLTRFAKSLVKSKTTSTAD